MPAVKPPEWDAMSAKEQLLWYLERLCAQADEMSSVLGIARVGDPPVVTSLVDPAASTTTHASPTPVPDVSGSTTKVQEVLEVIQDAPPACIAMAHINCSTDGSNQVVATNSANKVTTIYPEPVIDLSDKRVEQFTDSTVSAESLAVVTATVVSSNPGKYAAVEAPPDVLTTPAVPTSISSSTTKAKEVFEVAYDVPQDSITKTLVSYSTDCSNQVVATSSFRGHDLDISLPTRHQGLLMRPTPWPSFLADHMAEGNENRPTPWPSFQIGVPSEDKDDSCFSEKLFHEGKKWLSELCDCSITMAPPVQHSNLAITTAHLLLSMQKMVALSTERSSKKILQFMQFGPYELVCYKLQGPISSLFASVVVQTVFSAYTIDSLLSWEFGRCTIMGRATKCSGGYTVQFEPRPVFKFSQETIQLKPPWPSFSCDCRAVQVLSMSMRWKFLSIADLRASWMYLLSVHLTPCSGKKVVCWIHSVARAISVIRRLIDVRLKWWSKLPNGEPPDDCYSSVTPFSSLVTPSFYVVCSLESTEHQFLAIPEQVSELAGTFGLDKFLSTSNMVCEI
uniref:Uncharacterized protein n=1 Tax=Aegilops tauschii subsp. strangulata TaxID=200361 RepID=A0A453F6U2_AEGTS